MKQIITQRDADTEPLQDINYVYDAVGNIVYVKDNAQQTFYFDNSIIHPESFYTYDALYRLIESTGRENFNNTGFYEVTTPQGLGGTDVQNYERSFEYDLVGNITKMQHAASANSFTKHFHYDNDNNQLTRIFIGSSVSPLESYTYDEHGNMLASNDRQFTYNLLDQLQVVDITGGSWKAFYMYNAEGQRDRKTVNNIAGSKDRFYFQNYERYCEYDNADDLVLERYTHHITDGEKKVATLDQETGSNTMYRYQYGNNLGSVGLELDDSAAIISYQEYYPFGGTAYYAHNSAIDVPLKRYKYCGKEQDEETGLYYYGARYYAPWLCRFTSVDPKALEYIHQSSYAFADNNPIVKYDVNGEGTNGDGTEVTDNKNKAGNNTAVASTTSTAIKPKPEDLKVITPEEKANMIGPTDKEAAAMSSHVYGDRTDGILQGGWKVSSNTFGIQLIDDNTGFKSALYERKITSGAHKGEMEYVYVTAGTDDLKDVVHDVTQAFGISKQYDLSKKNALILSSQLANISFAGHSLGGGMAAANAYFTGKNATTFNAAGVSNFTIKSNNNAHIRAIILTSDPLNKIQNSNIGPITLLAPDVNGVRVYLQPIDFGSTMSGHSINNLLKNYGIDASKYSNEYKEPWNNIMNKPSDVIRETARWLNWQGN